MKFVHTADWQLGKPFGRFEPEVRAALAAARLDAVDAIGAAAVNNGADHILVAGDIFDTDGPEDRIIVQAISRMERYPCCWWLLPGNHDCARNGGLWARVRQRAGASITVLMEPVALEIEAGAWLLPAPLTHRHNLEDPTDLFDGMATPDGSLRIGLAHGSIRDFSTQGETKNQIAPDRARRSHLNYLALGDWHGALSIDSRTWYAGTPETDRFLRDAPGQALLVDVEPGRDPVVAPVRTGRFQWLRRSWVVNDQAAFDAERDRLLAEIDPSATLLELSLAGITSIQDRVAMLGRLQDDVGHRLRYLDVRAADLIARPSEDDLAALAIEGMISVAAAKLTNLVDAGGPGAVVAKRALERLYVEYSRVSE